MYIGIDGYKAPYDSINNKFEYRWAVVVIESDDSIKFHILNNLDDFWKSFKSKAKKILIDEPLGLEDIRACDIEARKYLQGNGSSKVFLAPSYDTQMMWSQSFLSNSLLLHSDNQLQSQQKNDTGHRLSQATYGIMRYIHEARSFIIRNSLNLGISNSAIIAESHPEVCFASYNKNVVLSTSKTKQDGKFNRINIITKKFPNFLNCAENSLNWNGYAAMDDILDATILAITSKDIYENPNSKRTFPFGGIVKADLNKIPIGIEYF